MPVRTDPRYLEGLGDGREVWVEGGRVKDAVRARVRQILEHRNSS